MSSVSAIAKFFAGRSVFITGGSGFVGKQTIEKLLRSCPDIERIYVLMRSKKDKTVEQRLENISQLPLFARLCREQPNFKRKIVGVSGTLQQPGFGISDADHSQISSNASIVFHIAASVRLAEPMREAVVTNVLGTRYAIELTRSLKNPEGFVHVSTAYSNPHRYLVEEKVYDPPMDPEKLVSLIDILNSEQLTVITPNLLGQFPNTYPFTKAVAERLVENEIGSIPCAIVRPSIICPSIKEPLEGWVDNITGINGLMAGVGLGMMSYIICNCEKSPKADLIPVDIVANAAIAAVWDIALNRHTKEDSSAVTVYNLTTGDISPITYEEAGRYAAIYANQYPLSYRIRKTSRFLSTHNNRYWLYRKFEEHIEMPIRCFVADTIAKLMGRKPEANKTLLQFIRLRENSGYFNSREWDWKTDNLVRLEKSLSPVDSEIFNLNREIKWSDYLRTSWFGMRKYIFRDPIESTKESVTSHEQSELRFRL